MSNNLKEVLADKIIEYVKTTIRGNESGTYKVASGIIKIPGRNSPVDLDMIINTEKMQGFITTTIARYFNTTWESLVVKDDPQHPKFDKYVNDVWDDLLSVLGHGPVCLMSVIGRLCIEVNRNLDRSQLDISSYESYMKSLDELLEKVFRESFHKMTTTRLISHVCNGEKKATPCEPGKNFFMLGDKDDFSNSPNRGMNDVMNNVGKFIGEVTKKNVSRPMHKCANCNKRTIKRCGNCKKRYICCRKCQIQDWKIHKKDCIKSKKK